MGPCTNSSSAGVTCARATSRWLCIVSVTLGVATMIVVNSVMAGFTHEMQGRLNGMLGDLIVRDPQPRRRARRRRPHGEDPRGRRATSIVGMSPTVHVPALLYVHGRRRDDAAAGHAVGIDEATYATVSQFGEFLQHPENRKQLSFNLRDDGYDVLDHQVAPADAKPREVMRDAGWKYRAYKAMLAKQRAADEKRLLDLKQRGRSQHGAGGDAAPVDAIRSRRRSPPSGEEPEGRDFDPATRTTHRHRARHRHLRRFARPTATITSSACRATT